MMIIFFWQPTVAFSFLFPFGPAVYFVQTCMVGTLADKNPFES